MLLFGTQESQFKDQVETVNLLLSDAVLVILVVTGLFYSETNKIVMGEKLDAKGIRPAFVNNELSQNLLNTCMPLFVYFC